MKIKRLYVGVTGALVAGVILASASVALAAPPATAGAGNGNTNVVTTCGNLGLRLGSAIRDGGGRLLDVVATLSGKSTEDIQTARQAGQTFTQIATDNGVDTQAVVADAMKVRTQLLDAKVADGTITQAQADTALAAMQTKVTEQLQSVNTDCGNGTGCGMGGGQGQGCGMGGGQGRGMGGGQGLGSPQS
jgi:hypothetical protein